jgi:hypothetical protein
LILGNRVFCRPFPCTCNWCGTNKVFKHFASGKFAMMMHAQGIGLQNTRYHSALGKPVPVSAQMRAEFEKFNADQGCEQHRRPISYTPTAWQASLK